MKQFWRSPYLRVLCMLLLLAGVLCTACMSGIASDYGQSPSDATLTEDGWYKEPQEVADYLHIYGHLPNNFITKNEAKKLGWDNQSGNLDEVAPDMSIGGDLFGNREGLLPEKDGRKYYECDVNYEGGYRNGERIIYSNDGLIFYTADHYKSFEQLY